MRLSRRSLVGVLGGAPTLVHAPAASAQSHDQIAQDLIAYDSFGWKRAGGPGDEAARAYMAQHLTRAGFTLSTHTVQAPFFDPVLAAVDVDGVRTAVEPQAIVVPTAPEGLTSPLAYVADGGIVDAARGKIAVVALAHRRHSALAAPSARGPIDAAIKAGARAVIAITNGPSGETIALNAPAEAPLFSIPVAVLGPRPGLALIAAARRGATARLIINGRGGRRPAHTLIAERRGESPLLVASTPRSGWYICAAERGPGFAIFLDLARWAARRFPRRRLLFISASAHEYDNQGMDAYLKAAAAAAAAAAAPADVKVWAHLGANIAGADFHDLGATLAPLQSADSQRYLVGPEALLPVLSRAFSGLAGLERPYPLAAGAAGELAHIHGHGFTQAFGVFGASRLHHVETDRLPHATNAIIVAEAAMAFRRAICALC